MAQLIGIPGLQYPDNAVWNFAPVTNALNTYRQASDRAEQWPLQRNALMIENDLGRARLEAMPLEQAMRQAQIDQIRQAIAASRQQQALRAGIMGQIGGLLSGGADDVVPPAPPAEVTSPPQQQPSALGPVTPRSVRLLPLDSDSGAAMVRPSAGSQAPQPPRPPATVAPQHLPGGSMDFAFPPASSTPEQPSPARSSASRPAQGGAETPQPPPASRIPLPPVAPQVRGALYTEGEPDFVGTPMARGVAPTTAAQPRPAPVAQPPAPAPAPAPVPAQQAPSAMVLGMPIDRARRLALMLDAAGMRNEFLEKEIASAGATNSEAEKARGQALGKAQGEAQANLPQAAQSATSMIRNIDAVIDDPYLGYVTGFGSSHFNPWAWTPGTPWSRDTMARIGQLQGQAFLQAYQTLRGGGQITEVEGKKAQEAIARLADLSQTDAGYIEALNDARFEIWDLANLARRRAGQQPIPYTPHRTDTRRLTRITGDADYANLPSGTPFIDPEGNVRTKP